MSKLIPVPVSRQGWHPETIFDSLHKTITKSGVERKHTYASQNSIIVTRSRNESQKVHDNRARGFVFLQFLKKKKPQQEHDF